MFYIIRDVMGQAVPWRPKDIPASVEFPHVGFTDTRGSQDHALDDEEYPRLATTGNVPLGRGGASLDVIREVRE
jgi:hypothetical protein